MDTRPQSSDRPAKTGHLRRRGYIRLIGLLIWWNLFALMAAGIFVAVFMTDQANELLRISDEHGRGANGPTISLWLPLSIYALQVGISSLVVAYAGDAEIAVLSGLYGIDSSLPIRLARVAMPLILGLLPLLTLSLVTGRGVEVLFALLLLVVLGWINWRIAQSRRRFGIAMLLSVVAILSIVSIWIAISPSHARSVGTIGILLIALSLWSALLTLCFTALPLSLCGVNLAWLAPIVWLSSSFLHDPNTFPRANDIRAVDRSGELNNHDPAPIGLVLSKWLRSLPATNDHERIPIYLVSAEGGGIRAAFWTARVLAEANARSNGRFSTRVFAYSGVSGGSLGITAFFDAVRRARTPHEVTAWVEDFLGRDFLAPLVSRTLVSEPWWQLLGSRSGVIPRDTSLERQWADDWLSVTGSNFYRSRFLQAFSVIGQSAMPVFFFNSTNVETGKRTLFSNAELNEDDLDYYSPMSIGGLASTARDLSVAEVVHLSARFPYLSPPASLQAAVPVANKGGLRTESRLWGRLVDGGYYDNSGGAAILDLVHTLIEYRSASRSSDQSMRYQVEHGGVFLNDIRSLVARLQIIVLVIRNDPTQYSRHEASEYPLLSGPPSIYDEYSPGHDRLTDGTLGQHMPSRFALAELLGPLDTVVNTRDARGMSTRRTLQETIEDASYAYENACADDDARKSKSPGGQTSSSGMPDCFDPKNQDEYDEISLGDLMAVSALDLPASQSLHRCVIDRGTSNIALGWVLSTASQRTLSCMAAQIGDSFAHAPGMTGPP